MRKLVREIVLLVRNAGGSNIWVSEGGNHTRVHFTNEHGRHSHLIVHRGSIVSKRHAAMIRSQIRRRVGS